MPYGRRSETRALGLLFLAIVVFAPLFGVAAQQPGKVYRVGWLAPAPLPTTLGAFRDGLRAFGYVEGNNLVIEPRYAEGKAERLAGLVAELVSAHVDVIVTTGNQATRAAKAMAGSTPVVFVAGNPVESGLVASLARPGGTMTGLNTLPRELDAKRLELLREAFPKVSRVAILFETQHLARAIPQVEAAARSLGVQVTRLEEIRDADDIERVLEAVGKTRAGALMPLSSALFHGERHRIVNLVAKHRLPAIYEHRDFVEAGGVLSYGPDIIFLNRRVAAYVDKIFKGARPADLPVEDPTKFELVVNRKTARALALTIPQPVLLRADQIID